MYTTYSAHDRPFMTLFRHHVFVKIPPKQVQLAEVGPRFEMKRASHFATSLRYVLIYSRSVRDSVRHDRADGGRQGMGAITLLPNREKEEFPHRACTTSRTGSTRAR